MKYFPHCTCVITICLLQLLFCSGIREFDILFSSDFNERGRPMMDLVILRALVGSSTMLYDVAQGERLISHDHACI